VRRRWCVLLLGLLIGCGRPLQISMTPMPDALPSQIPFETAPPLAAASGVPSAAPPTIEDPEGASPPPASTAEPATATLTPTLALPTMAPATQAAQPTSTPAVIVVPRTAVPQTNEQRWREQQLDRQVLEPPRVYLARSPVTLWWYDPLTSQSLAIGSLVGAFPVQATFTLRSEQRVALEVPYTINADFGLTAISEAVRERMRKAGFTQSVEAYVLQSEDVHPT
jgi:hypothetical protein